jgi:hypothetical protein
LSAVFWQQQAGARCLEREFWFPFCRALFLLQCFQLSFQLVNQTVAVREPFGV